jgi:chemotaxis protein MotB
MAAAGKNKDDDNKRPIIIKKIKKGGHGGHHGGAWKVAYADFVTAMMAFFLLLWLLASTSKAKLEGLAEFFTPTVGIKDGQGIGFKGGISESEEGKAKTDKAQPGLVSGRTPTGDVPETPDKAKSESDQDADLFKKGATAIQQSVSQEAALSQYKDNIIIQQTTEGLRIDIADSDKYAMFERGTAALTEHGKAIISRITKILIKMPNYVSITGNTDASPNEQGRADYTNWELSSDRAQTTRRFMIASGMEQNRPKKVVGMADQELLTPSEPRNPRNRRIAIVMLRNSHLLIPDGAVPPDANASDPNTLKNWAPAAQGAAPAPATETPKTEGDAAVPPTAPAADPEKAPEAH